MNMLKIGKEGNVESNIHRRKVTIMKKIDSKILMIYFIFASVSVFLTVYISYRIVNSILLEHASSLGTACAELEAKEIDSWLKGRTTLLQSTREYLEE